MTTRLGNAPARCEPSLSWSGALPLLDPYVDLKEHYWRVLYDIVEKSAPEVPWQWGFCGLLCAASAAGKDHRHS